MAEWIKLEKASQRYNLPVNELESLIKNQEISFLLLKERYIDSEDLRDYIERKNLSFYAQLENEIVFYLNDFENGNLYDDFIKPKQLPKKDGTLYNLIIKEMSMLLHREDLRNIFYDVCTLANMSIVAQKYNMPTRKVYYYYKICTDYISKRLGRFKQFQIENTELKHVIRQKNLLINSLRKQLVSSSNSLNLENKSLILADYSPNALTEMALRKLTWKIEKLGISTRLINILKPMDLYTVEDLLRYIKDFGFESLMNKKNFGVKCYEELVKTLITHEIMNDETTSPYFKYL